VPGRPAQGIALAVLSATFARHYYLEGRSKIDIAEEYGMSRFKVARLIEAARRNGMVRIQLDPRGDVDIELSSQLQAAYGLRPPKNDPITPARQCFCQTVLMNAHMSTAFARANRHA
jgi:hypothetical protein